MAIGPKNSNMRPNGPRADEGGLDAINTWIKSKDTPRLIVIDVLEAFRSRSRGKDNVYAADYAAIKALQIIASELHVAILIVHHLRKAASDDNAQDKISGTLGLPGAAVTYLILDKGPNGVTLEGSAATLWNSIAAFSSIEIPADGRCSEKLPTFGDRRKEPRYWMFSRMQQTHSHQIRLLPKPE
jgi:AAA domain